MLKKFLWLALVALAALAIAIPAGAKPPAPNSHKCKPHPVSYRVAGSLVSGALTANGDGTYSGTLTVHVTRANQHAKADLGTDKAYTLDHAKVKLHGENPAALAAGSRVHLKGTITTLAKKCDHSGFTPTVSIKKADITPPKSS